MLWKRPLTCSILPREALIFDAKPDIFRQVYSGDATPYKMTGVTLHGIVSPGLLPSGAVEPGLRTPRAHPRGRPPPEGPDCPIRRSRLSYQNILSVPYVQSFGPDCLIFAEVRS